MAATDKKSMSVKLATYLGASLTEKPTVSLGDFKAASEAVRGYITRLGIGAKDWKGGEVKEAMGKTVAFVSYNGKVWSKNPAKATDAVCLYDPHA